MCEDWVSLTVLDLEHWASNKDFVSKYSSFWTKIKSRLEKLLHVQENRSNGVRICVLVPICNEALTYIL